jgi:hypothetical protein
MEGHFCTHRTGVAISTMAVDEKDTAIRASVARAVKWRRAQIYLSGNPVI